MPKNPDGSTPKRDAQRKARKRRCSCGKLMSQCAKGGGHDANAR